MGADCITRGCLSRQSLYGHRPNSVRCDIHPAWIPVGPAPPSVGAGLVAVMVQQTSFDAARVDVRAGTEDKMIPPDAQRAMSTRAGSTIVEVKGSHAVYVSD
jgi:hypothetical protein